MDECFIGTNNSIQHAAVRYIIETVVEGLRDHPDRTFSYSEQGFFQRFVLSDTRHPIASPTVISGPFQCLHTSTGPNECATCCNMLPCHALSW